MCGALRQRGPEGTELEAGCHGEEGDTAAGDEPPLMLSFEAFPRSVKTLLLVSLR